MPKSRPKHQCKSHGILFRRVGACEAGFRRVVVNRLTRHVQTQATDSCSNNHNDNVDNHQCNLAGRGKVPAPVEVQPVNTTKTNCKDQSVRILYTSTFLVIHFRYSGGSGGRDIQLNQLAKRALIKLSRFSKEGIPSAIIQAMIQQVTPMPTHEPTDTRSRPPMR